MTTTCEKCGVELHLGDWAFCPHGRYSGTVISDSIPGGQLIENLGPDPIRVYSETERRRIMKERGLVDYVRHRPGDPLTSKWDTVTQKTLEDAADLVSEARRTNAYRVEAEQEAATNAELETLSLIVTELTTGFTVKPDGEPHG
jgi:hypothetical protein